MWCNAWGAPRKFGEVVFSMDMQSENGWLLDESR